MQCPSTMPAVCHLSSLVSPRGINRASRSLTALLGSPALRLMPTWRACMDGRRRAAMGLAADAIENRTKRMQPTNGDSGLCLTLTYQSISQKRCQRVSQDPRISIQ